LNNTCAHAHCCRVSYTLRFAAAFDNNTLAIFCYAVNVSTPSLRAAPLRRAASPHWRFARAHYLHLRCSCAVWFLPAVLLPTHATSYRAFRLRARAATHRVAFCRQNCAPALRWFYARTPLRAYFHRLAAQTFAFGATARTFHTTVLVLPPTARRNTHRIHYKRVHAPTTTAVHALGLHRTCCVALMRARAFTAHSLHVRAWFSARAGFASLRACAAHYGVRHSFFLLCDMVSAR